MEIDIARDRAGKFSSKLIQKYDRYEKAMEKDIALMFLSGLSTRGISMVLKALLGRKISASEVSKVNTELLTGIEAWRMRPLYGIDIKYMYVDFVNFEMRVENSIEKVPMLVVIGVTGEKQKIFLTIQQGDKDCGTTWREIFKDLKKRGLDGAKIQLGIMDGLPGLEKVFQEEFINAKITTEVLLLTFLFNHLNRIFFIKYCPLYFFLDKKRKMFFNNIYYGKKSK